MTSLGHNTLIIALKAQGENCEQKILFCNVKNVFVVCLVLLVCFFVLFFFTLKRFYLCNRYKGLSEYVILWSEQFWEISGRIEINELLYVNLI